MRLLRLARILITVGRYGLDELVLGHERFRLVRPLFGALTFWRRFSEPRAVRLRRALETLGPIFVKFGQMISTRRDLLPEDIADELAQLQDRVPPFPSELAIATLARVYGKPVGEVFAEFDPVPVASASVAQVHLGRLPSGEEIAVKILRPDIRRVIDKDIGLLDAGAWLMEKVWREGKRLRPREVVAEFAKHLDDELDLMREAANCSQLRRNWDGSGLLLVPEVHWDWCHSEVMVMTCMHGTGVSNTAELKRRGVDLKKLAVNGVTIFFTQVFRDAFFHADMHPGNILVTDDGTYVAMDFGIMGTLTEVDQNYLAQNFLGFFRRDYRRVAEAHIEAGWAPAGTRVDEFESAIRAVCEPVFDRPIKEISFGRVLVRLFETSRRFGVEIQPQLVLLQKTLINIEGLGRMIDPDLDLWTTAKPFLERWMRERVGVRGLLRHLKREAPQWAPLLPKLPRLMHDAVERAGRPRDDTVFHDIARELKRQNRRLALIALILVVVGALVLVR